jgi:hypothetical protein
MAFCLPVSAAVHLSEENDTDQALLLHQMPFTGADLVPSFGPRSVIVNLSDYQFTLPYNAVMA